MAAGAAFALSAIVSQAQQAPGPEATEALLIGGAGYEWAEDAGEGYEWAKDAGADGDITQSNWHGKAAIHIFLPDGPYMSFGFVGASDVSLEANDEDWGNDSRRVTLNASLGYSFNNWTPFVELSRTRLTVDCDRCQIDDSDNYEDWADPTYALGTWIRSSETTRFRLAMVGLEADDPDIGFMTGFYARPAASRRFVLWGDIGYVPKVRGVAFGLGIGVKLGKMGR